ncbi:glycoside hydrolase family 88/105 protein [Jiulongibacter sp. NS-SX5]|uniref:glycoside hydrolase family 88/105 protein n=1 Tax=Jiulongibacter sp. NS-SX5 TaxID=3463854 RepID=UPI0040583E2A
MKTLSKLLFALCAILLLSCSQNAEDTQQETQISEELNWSERLAQSVIERNPDPVKLVTKKKSKWNYKIGLFMTSLERLYQKTGNERYLDYMKNYTDQMIDENGQIFKYSTTEYNIDNVNAGKFLFFMKEKTGDERFQIAMDSLREQLKTHPRTNSGGFWHKQIYPYQMWLDGLYMGAPFYARYNVEFENGDQAQDIIHQFDEIEAHLKDENTGLLFHGWDESKQMDWADKETGRSPNFWTRSMGWYAMALVDVLDILPEETEGRDKLIQYLNDLSEAIIKVRDPETKIWWQVTDKPHEEGNYLEASGSSMFIYALARGAKHSYLDQQYLNYAKESYDGLIKNLTYVHENGSVDILQVCKSAGLGGNPYRSGSYEYYISEPMLTNDIHGMGPFVLASLEIEE